MGERKKRIAVSGGGMLSVLGPEGVLLRQTHIAGAGALCAGGGNIYCASDEERAIWRLDARTLMPTGLFAGGPGMCALRLSADGARLYVLCADGDSVIMLDARDGAPLVLSRAGVGPQSMALDETVGVLAVAGGEACAMLLYRADTLERIAQIDAPGPVHAVALNGGAVYALCRGEVQDSLLLCVLPCGRRRMIRLAGMPGTLLLHGKLLFAGMQGHVCAFSHGCMRPSFCLRAPGLPSCMAACGEGLIYADAYAHRLRAAGREDAFAQDVPAQEMTAFDA